jgi:hypothetical protein
MRLIARVRSWLRASSRRADFERDMRDEMQAHLELYQADLRRRGLSEEEAHRRARADFGSVPARQDECREAVGLRLLDELRGDVAYAFRLLRRSPALSTTPAAHRAAAAALRIRASSAFAITTGSCPASPPSARVSSK